MKKLSMVALSVASLAGMLAVPSQVHAGADATNSDIIGITGSDTTYFVMNALSDAHNLSARYNPNGDKAVNIPPLVSANASVEAGEPFATTPKAWLKNARLAWPGGVVLPADANCTTQYVFGGLGANDANSDGDVTDGGDAASTSVTSIPGSAVASEVRLGVIPPNGSGDGQKAISGSAAVNGVTYNNVANGFSCFDIGRSSSYPTAADVGVKYEAWAFALDAIGWNYFPGNTNPAVANGLTTADMNKIYQCASSTVDVNGDLDYYDTGDMVSGYPKIRYWNQLTANSDVDGTAPAMIAAYRIQPGSGTGKDVASVFFGRSDGIDSEVLKDCEGYSGKDTDSNPATKFEFPIVQEHDCRNVSTVDKPNAICFYGYSRWVLQARALETDKRNGAIFGKYGASSSDVKRPSFSTINDSQTRYIGTRWIYNLLPLNAGAAVGRTNDATRFVGVSLQPAGCSDGNESGADDCNFDGDTSDSGVTVGGVAGFVCGDPLARRIIASYGFKPISYGPTDANNSNYGQSNCRRNRTGF